MTAHRHRIAGLPLALAATTLALSACANDMNGILSSPVTGEVLDPPAPRLDALDEIRSLCGTPEPVGEQLARLPYVQSVQHDSAQILWTTRAQEPESVEWWIPGDEPTSASATLDPTHFLRDARQLRLPLESLQAGELYCYRLVDRDGQVVYGPTGFRTPPPPGGGTARIVVFGDSGAANDDQDAVLAQIRTVAVDAVLHTGDLAYDHGSLDELETKHFAIYAELMSSVPFFPSLGDHDYDTAYGGPYLEAFALPDEESRSERWYSFDWGPVHVVVLDSNVVLAPQRMFLERDLAEHADAPWTIVVISRPLYSSGFHGGSRRVRKALESTMIEGGVDLVVSGDDHDYERTRSIQGVTYVVTGGGGRSVRMVGRSSFTALSVTVFHFVWIEATPERFRLHVIDGTGREFDGLEMVR